MGEAEAQQPRSQEKGRRRPALCVSILHARLDTDVSVSKDFYDHYLSILHYLGARRKRLQTFKSSTAQLDPDALQAEWDSYRGRERVLLRKRRTKLQLDQFHIIVQVGQGGYGEVFLARHKETNQTVALKKMRKKTLAKMDEVRPSVPTSKPNSC